MAKEVPTVAIVACSDHRPPDHKTVLTGPGGDADATDEVSEILMCWRCWESDEEGLRRLMHTLGFPEDQIWEVYRFAFSRKPDVH